MPNFLKTSLVDQLKLNRHSYTEIQLQLIVDYLKHLQKWNRVYNLTAIKHPLEMVTLHIMDSLSILPFLRGPFILDVGTGAGFPGVPLAIFKPEFDFVLLDSNSKKTHFLTHIKSELNLPNIQIIHARCEDFQPKTCFNTIVSRAFSSLSQMIHCTQHLLADSGQFLAMKGMSPKQEIAELPLNFKVVFEQDLIISGLNAKRCVISIERNL